MDFSKILTALKQGLSFAEELLPLLGAGGIAAATVLDVVNAVTDVAENIQTRIAEGKVVFSSTDQDQLKDIVARIQKVNDELQKQVDDS